MGKARQACIDDRGFTLSENPMGDGVGKPFFVGLSYDNGVAGAVPAQPISVGNQGTMA